MDSEATCIFARIRRRTLPKEGSRLAVQILFSGNFSAELRGELLNSVLVLAMFQYFLSLEGMERMEEFGGFATSSTITQPLPILLSAEWVRQKLFLIS